MNDVPKAAIEIVDTVVLRGPNVWTYCPIIEATVDIGALEDCPSNTIPGFPERLEAWLPGLVEHRCSPGVRGGFLQRLHEGTWPAHILEHVSLELMELAGLPAGFGRAREAEARGVYRVMVEAQQPEVTLAALRTSRDLVMAAIEDRPFDVAAAVESLRDLSESLWLGPSTAAIVVAADERRIPAIRLNDGNLVQFGHGARQRRIWTAETDGTSAIAEGVSRDKELTRRLLAECGVPVPEGRIVASPEDAWDAAQDIGLPVVVKPSDGNHGRGVFTNLSTREEVEAAWRIAVDEGSAVLVERFVVGNEHRVLVVGGRVVAAARGEPAWVTGDGRATVLELIECQLNSDPRRGTTEDHPLNRVRIDSAARIELARQGLAPESVPDDGMRVLIQRNGNVAFDVTGRVHPDVAEAVALAARIVGLDIAGIDLVAEDIGRPLDEQGGAIVEVNAGPGLLMHLKPAEGVAQPVGRAIVEHLFPGQADGRIPLVGVAGGHGRTAVARRIAQLLRADGRRTGLAGAGGVWLDRRVLQATPGADWAGGRRVLLNPGVEAAVIENDARVILREGLAYDRCSVGVVTSTTGDDSAGTLTATDEQRFKVLRTQVDVVLPSGIAVLDATDPMAVSMIELCDGEVVLFSADPSEPALAAHVTAGGRAVVARDGRLVLARGTDASVLGAIDDFAATLAEARALQAPGADDRALSALLAAAAAGWALGIEPARLRDALAAEADLPGPRSPEARDGRPAVAPALPAAADAIVGAAAPVAPATARPSVGTADVPLA